MDPQRTSRRRGLAACLLLGLACSRARAASLPESQISTISFVSPSTAAYASSSGTIRSISIERLNVFDPRVPGEDWWPFRLANKIHIPTREYVLRRELLLAPGDAWVPLRALESERNLRATTFIRKAELKPAPSAPASAMSSGTARVENDPRAAPGSIDLRLHAQDSWTTLPQINLGTEGGDRYLIYGIEELNVLGLGKSVSFFHAQIGPSRRNELRYNDPRLWGTWFRLTTLYGTTSRGDEVGTVVERPFFSLSAPYAMRALWTRIIQEDVLFQNALDASKFVQDFRSVDLLAGLKLPRTTDPVQRLHAGMHYEKDRFEATPDTAAGTLPKDRELSGPIIGYSLIQPRYIKETFIDKMERVEDFNIGNEFSTFAGAMPKGLGSDADRWTLSATDQQGLSLAPGRFALAQAGVLGRLRGKQLENSIFFANLNLFWKNAWPFSHTWVSHLEWNTTRNLDGENQIILGGNTGLRGYKNNSFTGARSVLWNIENRFFFNREFFHLFVLGGAVFFETGAVAQPGGSLIQNNFKSDLGFGFRLGPTRSTSGGVLRLDVAYALQHGPGPSRWVVSVRGGQAFEIFNSTYRNVIRTPVSALLEESPGARLRRR
ncbi:MAG: hypothetical protein HY551_05745 [Elusimicrobia bacterium]|nr:hypothetical protein [Elusimicrobiota bacterium]